MGRVSDTLNIDLNLMLALQALLDERSVTRAAHRLHLSQPTLSVALSKLRLHFDDRLLVREGTGYRLTALGERLSVQVTATVESTRRLFDRNVTWTPADASREFTVAGADYGFSVVGPTILSLAREVAPAARIRFISGGTEEDSASSLHRIDVVLRPHGTLVDLSSMNVWRDRWVAVAWVGNAVTPDVLGFEEAAASEWVLTHHAQSVFTSATLQLRGAGINLNVPAVVDSFFAVPSFVVGTDRLAIIPERLFSDLSGRSLRKVELPAGGDPIDFAIWWHPDNDDDPEHAWFRSLFHIAGRILSARARSVPRD